MLTALALLVPAHETSYQPTLSGGQVGLRAGARWLYLPMARWTGELSEYMQRSRERQVSNCRFTEAEWININSGDPTRWLRGLQSYTLRWVEQHKADAVDFNLLNVEGDATPQSARVNLQIQIGRFNNRRLAMPSCICDFCSEPHVAWRYPANSFAAYVVAGIVGESVGDWAACPTCHGLIESGRSIELAERSLRTLIEKQPEMRCAEAELRTQIRCFHSMFIGNRLGTALPVA